MQNGARRESWRDSFAIHRESTRNEQGDQAKRRDLPFPSLLPSIDWNSGGGQVALESGFYPSDVPEDSCSMQVSSQCRRILQVKAPETLQPYQPSTLLFQVVSSLCFSYASSCGGIIELNPPLAVLNYFPGCLLCLFIKYLQNHDGIIIDSVENTPRLILIIDTEFVASRSNRWHRSRMRQRE